MILAIIQARMSSIRLPGKVLKPILGQPVLALQVARTLRSQKIDKLIIATSIEGSDDPIEALCSQIGIDCYRGNLNDVLHRFHCAATQYQASHIVRLTGDCPLVDPILLDEIISLHLQGNFDYTSNIYPRSFPDGLDVEVMTMKTLAYIEKKAITPADREHVTLYLDNHKSDFNIGNIAQKDDQSKLRWTLDNQADFDFIAKIYHALYQKNTQFSRQDILDYLAL
jgi:spore coat polysaccharide biosynthesis protein SpsF